MENPKYKIIRDEKLMRLVPLVKVAWADGRVTRRERQLVMEIAARDGIAPKSEAFTWLENWLQLHPSEEFYDRAMEKLRLFWQGLEPEERDQRKFDLIADCADVAAVSGGNSSFAGGGARVCDEEIAVVKNIARKLNGANETKAQAR
jgi:hypothetical protein